VPAVLGVDAAWSKYHNSGVALVELCLDRWQCVRLAPSCEGFVNPQSSGRFSDVSIKIIDPVLLLRVSSQLLGGDCVQVVAIDMALSRNPITSRRPADDFISREFGKSGCGTHSPNPERPGTVSDSVRDGFAREGFALHTGSRDTKPSRSLIETFPHPALLMLCQSDYRLPYKVAKSRKYWPTAPLVERRERLKGHMQRILDALRRDIDNIPLDLRTAAGDCSFKALKPIEDMLDALVCAWVAIKYLEGCVKAFGDSSAAIWIPVVAGP